MSYIGDKPSQTLASPTSQYFNGDGSTVAFTLNRPVNVSEDLEVFVNNVQQEPGVGKSYTATGTTLTFDAAPSSGTANVYVVYRGLAEVTTRLEHDANAALAATTGTFSGSVTADGVHSEYNGVSDNMTTSPTASGVQIGSFTNGYSAVEIAGTSGGFIDFSSADGTDFDGRILYAHSNDSMRFYTSGPTERLRIDNSGNVTMPYQPAFWAYLSGNWTSWTPNNQTQVVPFDQAYHNIGNHFNGSTGLFTCPVDGNYVFTGGVYVGVTSVEQLWLVKNGVRQPTFGFANAGSSGDRSVGTFILRCSANDTIGLIPYAGPSTTSTVFANFFHSFFIGNLIG